MSATLISAFSGLAMVIIWLIYLQIFLVQYKRSKRPFLIIHHAHEKDPSALCLFVNMSREPVHVECVIAHIRGDDGYSRRSVMEYDRITPDDRHVQTRLRQGPIQSGGYLVLGSFEEIMLGVGSKSEDEGENRVFSSLKRINSLELCVAVVHGPSKHHIGARRFFLVEQEDGRPIIRALSVHTEQLVSRSKRKEVKDWIVSHLEPKFLGDEQTQESRQTKETASNPESKKSGSASEGKDDQ